MNMHQMTVNSGNYTRHFLAFKKTKVTEDIKCSTKTLK